MNMINSIMKKEVQDACDEELAYCAASNDFIGLSACLRAGANPFAGNSRAIIHAVNAQNMEALKMLVPLGTRSCSGIPLIAAAWCDEPQALNYLLQVVMSDIDLTSPLLVAAQSSKACFDLLLGACDPRKRMAEIERALNERYNPGEAPDMIFALAQRCSDLEARDRLQRQVAEAGLSGAQHRQRL